MSLGGRLFVTSYMRDRKIKILCKIVIVVAGLGRKIQDQKVQDQDQRVRDQDRDQEKANWSRDWSRDQDQSRDFPTLLNCNHLIIIYCHSL